MLESSLACSIPSCRVSLHTYPTTAVASYTTAAPASAAAGPVPPHQQLNLAAALEKYKKSSKMLRTCGRSLANVPLRIALQRCFSAAVQAETEAEKSIAAKIQEGLTAQSIRVSDTSGGCGAMYSIEVVSEEFKGMSIVKQHQLVTKLLKEQIAEWHGFQLVTKAP